MLKKVLSVLFLLLFLAGCVQYVKTGEKQFEPYNGTVRVFFDTVPVDFKYEEVGIISVKGHHTQQEAGAIEMMRKEVAKNGGNAVIIKRSVYPEDSAWIYMTGVAIRIQ